MSGPAASYLAFSAHCDAHPENIKIKKQMKKWIKYIKKSCKAKRMKLQAGGRHKTIKADSPDSRDLRFSIPKSKNPGKKTQDGEGLAKLLKNSGLSGKMTITWIICYLKNKKPKNGLEECSHRCCDYDENGVRHKDRRCVDPGCLTWESKSANQSRANPGCHRLCHCGCKMTICAANKIHNPPCL